MIHSSMTLVHYICTVKHSHKNMYYKTNIKQTILQVKIHPSSVTVVKQEIKRRQPYCLQTFDTHGPGIYNCQRINHRYTCSHTGNTPPVIFFCLSICTFSLNQDTYFPFWYPNGCAFVEIYGVSEIQVHYRFISPWKSNTSTLI